MASAAPGPQGLAAGDRFGPFTIEAPLGEGGSGQVFRARDPDGRTVALKLLKTSLTADESHTRRFVREARAAREIAHRHLVEVLDAGAVDGRRYLSMRYVAGRSLADRIDADGALGVDAAVTIVAEVAAGLDALHAAGVVHRDVKPSNVLLDAERGAMLTDFGLAKRTDYSTLTRPGTLLGTLDYIAPELLRGEDHAAPADVYALGCLAFECLAGRPPFGGRSAMAVGMAHLDDDPADPVAGRADAPPGFGAVVNLALAKEPSSRPATPGAYARMLIVAARSA